jgi:phosphoserine aminotransferase
MKKHNFSAGPAILPAEVIQEAAQGVLNLNGEGLSILELSHRGKQITAIFDEAEALMRELLALPAEYEVIFCTGGASTQFVLAPMNLLNEDETAAYVNTGTWATKAIEAAQMYGNINVLASSKATNFDHIPDFEVPSDIKYLHLTSNNTIFGTQIQSYPTTTAPIVCDMSSDFLSRPIDVEQFGLIYAGAQKNVGPSGVTVVIVRKDMLGTVRRQLPLMFDYRTFIKEKSMYNTPPVFPVYVMMLTLRWLKKLGGLAAMHQYNVEKAAILYNEIDRNPLFKGTVAEKDRSLMNVCFVMHDASLEAEFMKFAVSQGCLDIKGHRSVGGFRASIYNAMPKESVQFLADLMQQFAAQRG